MQRLIGKGPRGRGRLVGIALLSCALSPYCSYASPAQPADQNQGQEVFPIPTHNYDLSPDELKKYTKDALTGSKAAAEKLDFYYGSKEQWEKQIYWMTIRVENGDRSARLDLARALGLQGGDDAETRACFWYSQIVKDGTPDEARQAQREMEALIKYDAQYRRR